MTASEEHFDELVRHQIDVIRYGRTLADDIQKETEVNDMITAGGLVMALGDRTGNPARVQSLIDARLDHLRALRDSFVEQMNRLSFQEAIREFRVLRNIVSTNITTSIIPPTVGTIGRVAGQGFASGATIVEMFADIIRRELVQLNRTARAVRAGAIDAATEMANIFNQTKTELSRIATTSVNHVSNAARETVYDANPDAVQYLIWNSVFDSRTSAICRSRDSKVVVLGTAPVPQGLDLLEPQGARPPAHPNCRSVMQVVFAGEPIPRRENYEQWLRRQPAEFQDDALGRTRADLWRSGDVSIDGFVDPTGRPYNLNELKQREPFAFDRASIPRQNT